VMEQHEVQTADRLDTILRADHWARDTAAQLIKEGGF